MTDDRNITPEVLRKRDIRRRLLALLQATHRGCPGIWSSARELIDSIHVDGALLQYNGCEIKSQLYDLCEDRLVQSDDRGRVRITTTGRDFVDAGHPWDAVDEFTGHHGGGP